MKSNHNILRSRCFLTHKAIPTILPRKKRDFLSPIIDDISAQEKSSLAVDDLLDKFADLRKREKLTNDIVAQLRREYV